MVRTLAAAACSVVVLALPASGLAMHGPVGGVPAAGTASPVNYLRDGKYTQAPAVAAPVQVVRVVKPGGFDFRDAAIGAVVGALALTILGGTLLVTRHERSATHVHARTGV
jgi:hypothetical protein